MMGVLSTRFVDPGRALATVVGTVIIAAFFVSNARYVLYQFEHLVYYLTGQVDRRNKNEFLKSNFRPVTKEVEERDLEVVGELPKTVDGVFVRTGPNPFYTPVGDYHWFDGDGMLHAVRIKDGKASYANRYVATSRLQQEKAAGHTLFGKFGDYVGLVGMFAIVMDGIKTALGVIDKKNGGGTANTALVYHAKRLLALHEGDLPYAVRVLCSGVVETLGRVTFGGQWKYPFTAHPKLDPTTGELYFFGYQFNARPYVNFGRLSAEGQLVASVPIDIPEPVMMHDMGLAGDYIIFIDSPLCFKPELMVKTGSMPFFFDKSRPTRFGVLPKKATSSEGIRWFYAPPCVIFHIANGWQESPDLIKLYAVAFCNEFTLSLDGVKDPLAGVQHLMEYTLDLSTAGPEPHAGVRQVSEVVGDFPQVPWNRIGECTRYAYLGVIDPLLKSPKMTGVAKIDLTMPPGSDGCVGIIHHGAEYFGGEAFFVPATTPDGEEDEGYLLTIVQDESKAGGMSELRVYDARSMAQQPLARVRLSHRVPHGFHSIHMSEANFRRQAASL